MNLHAKLLERAAAGRPITIGLIGAGKFGTMFLAQVRRTPGMHVVGVADLDVARARDQLRAAGWDAGGYAATSHAEAVKSRGTHVGDDATALIGCPEIEVIIEATGVPEAGIRHALAAIAHASTSSWSTSRRTRSPGRCSPPGPGRRAWSTASPGATSRR